MELIIGIGIFLTIILIIEGGYFTFKATRASEQKKVKRRLRTLSSAGVKNEDVNIVRKRLLSEVPWIHRLLLSIPRAHTFDRLLEEANARYPLGFYVLLSLLLASCGYLVGYVLHLNNILRIVIGLILSCIPYLSLLSAKQKRMQKFERQLPDAIDLLVRALRAGHAFSGGLKMVADEFDDPIGTEFEKVMDEVNFGVAVPEALVNLSNRVDCPDLKFFIVSVIIQRETGGNLAEVLEKIAYLIRERFKLQGKIKVLSAEGRLSAIILVALPILVGVYLTYINPDYLMTLFTDPVGKVMVALGLIQMIVGVLVMKRMVTIKV